MKGMKEMKEMNMNNLMLRRVKFVHYELRNS
jgi:hypothetical protein